VIARIVAWLKAHIGRADAKNDGYWGGVTMWDRVKAIATRKGDGS